MRKRHNATAALLSLAISPALSKAGLAQGVADREALTRNPPLFLELARKSLKWDEPAEPTRIVGPIYSVGTKGLGVFLIQTTEGLILINTAMPGSGPTTEAAIRKLGFDPKNVRLLLTGHAHSDHAGAHAYLKRLSGARVAVINLSPGPPRARLRSVGRRAPRNTRRVVAYTEAVNDERMFASPGWRGACHKRLPNCRRRATQPQRSVNYLRVTADRSWLTGDGDAPSAGNSAWRDAEHRG